MIWSAVEYYENVSTADATPIPVVAGQMVRNINFVLGDGADTATISGTGRGAAEPLAGIFVNLIARRPVAPCQRRKKLPHFAQALSQPGIWLRIVLSDQDGHYRVWSATGNGGIVCALRRICAM
ncbi:MAG: hypothetical protein R2932_24685 [Caldilineaceae bacterium]